MAAAASSNRFMPLSSPKSLPTSRNSSPSRPDASQQRPRSPSPPPTRSDAFEQSLEQSRSPSPSPSGVPQPCRTIRDRIATYPEKWTYKLLLPKMLASCGLCYYTASGEDACICRECDAPAVPLRELEADTNLSYDKLISLHYAECLLADTLEDLIRQEHHIRILASPAPTVPATMSQSPSSHVATNPSPKSQGPKPSEHAAAATAPPPPPKVPPSPSPPPSPCPVLPTRLSYATVASRPAPTPSPTPSKPPRASTSTPSAQQNTPPTPDAKPALKSTPQHPLAIPTSSPVLSIYDLERRFSKKPSPLQGQRRLPPREPQPIAIASPQYTAIAHLLHAIADLLGCHNTGHMHNTRNLWPVD